MGCIKQSREFNHSLTLKELASMATNNSANDGTRTAHGIFIAEGASAPVFTVLTNGQLLVGSTGSDPQAASITAGTGISVTPGAGSITIANTAAGFTWNDTTGTSATLAAANGYVADNASLVTLTLPTTAALGDTYTVLGKGAGGWLVQATTGQTMHLGNAVTTITTGSLASTNQWDSLTITCVTANTTFTAYAVTGNITVV